VQNTHVTLLVEWELYLQGEATLNRYAMDLDVLLLQQLTLLNRRQVEAGVLGVLHALVWGDLEFGVHLLIHLYIDCVVEVVLLLLADHVGVEFVFYVSHRKAVLYCKGRLQVEHGLIEVPPDDAHEGVILGRVVYFKGAIIEICAEFKINEFGVLLSICELEVHEASCHVEGEGACSLWFNVHVVEVR
jgi:hypothetical protein